MTVRTVTSDTYFVLDKGANLPTERETFPMVRCLTLKIYLHIPEISKTVGIIRLVGGPRSAELLLLELHVFDSL